MLKKKTVFTTARALTLAAMLAAMSVVIGIFCKNFLDFGGGLLRITFENLPIILSGIIFGPVVGGLVGCVSDLVSYLLSNQVYPPNLWVTFGACAVGVVSGSIAKYVIKNRGRVQIIVSAAAAHIIGSMIIKTIGLYKYYGVAVLVRIPTYIVIASVEIILICLLMQRRAFARLFEKL